MNKKERARVKSARKQSPFQQKRAKQGFSEI